MNGEIARCTGLYRDGSPRQNHGWVGGVCRFCGNDELVLRADARERQKQKRQELKRQWKYTIG